MSFSCPVLGRTIILVWDVGFCCWFSLVNYRSPKKRRQKKANGERTRSEPIGKELAVQRKGDHKQMKGELKTRNGCSGRGGG